MKSSLFRWFRDRLPVQKGIARVFVVILLVALVAAAGVAGTAYFLFLKPRPAELSARLMPPETETYLTVNLRPGADQISKVRDVVRRFQGVAGFDDRFDDLAGQLERESGIRLRRDVLPWLAEVALGVIEVNGLDRRPSVVALVRMLNTRAAENVLEDLIHYSEKVDSIKFVRDEYRGYSIRTDGESRHYALIQDSLILCSKGYVLEDVIDRLEDGGDSLLDTEKFQAAWKAVPKERVGFAFADAEALYRDIRRMARQGIMPEDVDEFFDRAERSIPSFVAVSAAFADRGFRVDFYADMEGKDAVALRPNKLASTRLLPGDTLFLYSFPDLAAAWEKMRSSLAANTREKLGDVQRGLEQTLQVGLDDVFGWMTGEIAIALMPSDLWRTPSGDLEGTVEAVALFETEERDQAVELLDKIRGAAESMGLEFKVIAMDGGEAVVLDLPMGGGYSPGFMFLDDFMVLGSSRDSLGVLVDVSEGKTPSLSGTKEFADAAGFVKNDGWMLYCNVQGVAGMVLELLPAEEVDNLRREYLRYTDLLEAVVITGSSTEEAATGTLLVTFAEHDR